MKKIKKLIWGECYGMVSKQVFKKINEIIEKVNKEKNGKD